VRSRLGVDRSRNLESNLSRETVLSPISSATKSCDCQQKNFSIEIREMEKREEEDEAAEERKHFGQITLSNKN
jgi:hypothetical protein